MMAFFTMTFLCQNVKNDLFIFICRTLCLKSVLENGLGLFVARPHLKFLFHVLTGGVWSGGGGRTTTRAPPGKRRSEGAAEEEANHPVGKDFSNFNIGSHAGTFMCEKIVEYYT